MKLEMKETATEFLFFVNNEPAARIKKQTDRFDSFVFHEGDVVEWTCKTAKETDHMCMELEDCFEAKHIVVPAVSYTRIRGERIMNTKVLRRMEFLIVLLIIERQFRELL